jgi:hypothetical protein
MEQRLITAFKTRGGFGVFQLYFPRSLLWMRDSTTALTKIDFPPDQKFQVPSWSWMAYNGSISFVNAPFEGVNWEPRLRSPWADVTTTSSWHTADLSSNALRCFARNFHPPPNNEGIVYDNLHPPPGRPVKCVVVGKEKLDTSSDETRPWHFVLIVTPKQISRSDKVYERGGVGILPANSIIFEGEQLQIQII